MESSPLPCSEKLATGELPRQLGANCPLKSHMDLSRLVDLDAQFREYADLRATTPRSGWVKTVRLALGMSSEALGARVSISPQGVRRLEQSEADGSISLNTLARIADGLDCDVRYVLVPRTSLVDKVVRRAAELNQGPLPAAYPSFGSKTLDAKGAIALSVLISRLDKRSFW